MVAFMASEPARRRATYQDLLDAPAEFRAHLVDGALHLMPRPTWRHQRVASSLGGDLEYPFGRGRGGPGGWLLLSEPELHLGEDVFVPDWVGWRRERLPELPSTSYIEVVPDWVCEILSPSTMRFDRVTKLPCYARAGVKHAWLIDPEAHTLEVFRLESGRWVLIASHSEAERVRAEPFDAIENALAELWADPPSTPAG
jgi:Uma2 family endonuclease